MTQQFDNINWQFDWKDRGTHSGNYFYKLQQLVDEFNNVIDGVNAQLQAGDDSAQIKSDIISIRDVDIANYLSQITGLRDQVIEIRNATNAIAASEINGMDVDFGSVKVLGVSVVLSSLKICGHPLNADLNLTKTDVGLAEVNNTSDADKPMSNATTEALNNLSSTTQAALNEIELLALAGLR